MGDAQKRVGLLYPGSSAEDDFAAFENRFDGSLRFPLVQTSVGEDAHREDALLDLGSSTRLAEGAAALAAHRPDSVMWACTSGSFVFGWDGARRQADELGRCLDRPASSTSIAFVNALHALGLHRVAVAASYPEDITAHLVAFLAHGGIEVTDVSSRGIVTAAEVGRLGRPDVLRLVGSVDLSDADALLVPDTAMHTLRWIDDLEEAAGKPVLTANQVTVWEGLNLLGPVPRIEDAGSLFLTGPMTETGDHP